MYVSLYLHLRTKVSSLLDQNAFVRAESGRIFLISNPENPEFPFRGNQVFITKELPRIPLFDHTIYIMYNYISGIPFSCYDSSTGSSSRKTFFPPGLTAERLSLLMDMGAVRVVRQRGEKRMILMARVRANLSLLEAFSFTVVRFQPHQSHHLILIGGA
ncbi:hypothetical protein SDJN02_18708, partial [Cucurbita argyrosperma subsp. argyrosperma]